ncbi:MAG: molybdopterin guanine dinucleotide-containing S/N-oxide reductase [Proteobacteria bacterium]|nr:molybdopterin guanine dinucleotide-containing S/N-oxide reductase [Pseudomonadota bacterium]
MSRQTVISSSHWGAFRAVVENGRFVDVLPFERDPHPNDLVKGLPAAVNAASRVDRPLIRKGWLEGSSDGSGRGREPFVPVDWQTALDRVAGEIRRVRETYGNQAIFAGSYGWASAGRFHHAPTLLHRFLGGFGGYVGQVTNYSYGAAMVLLPYVVGTLDPVTGPVTDWRSISRHTDLFVMFGGSPLKNGKVTAGGAGEHRFEPMLREAKAAGVDFVSISPVRDDAPDFLSAEWLAIRPNADTALMLALAHTLISEDLHDRAFLRRYTTGGDRLIAYILGQSDGCLKSAEWAASLTEIDAPTIRRLARRMAKGRTMLTAAWSLQRADHGEQPFWMLIALAALLGQIGLPGGGFGFGYGSINGMGNHRHRIAVPSMSAGANPLGFAIPVARVADLLLEPGGPLEFNGKHGTYPDIKLVYWAGGNPFHHHQDLNRLRRAFRRPEVVIVHEPWWTATARHADIVLPATTTIEREDVGASSRDRFVLAMHQAIRPLGEARDDYDIFADLAERLGTKAAFTEGRSKREWIRSLYDRARQTALERNLPMPDFDTFWEEGYAEIPEPADDFVLFQDFRADPAANPLRTPSGRIELFSETIAGFGYEDCPGHPVWLEPSEWLGSPSAARFPLHLVSNQPRTRLHSQLEMAPASLGEKVDGREALWIHPDDAAARGIVSGEVVRVHNDRGACLAGVKVTDAVRRGVVQLAAGAWYDPIAKDGEAELENRGNPNVLTLDRGTSRLGQGCAALTTLVDVERFAGGAPSVSAIAPPPISRS